MAIILARIGVSGFRSFGKDIQFFENFSDVNLFIGRNNVGKSNILRLLYDIIGGNGPVKELELDRHLPTRPPLTLAVDQPFELLGDGTALVPPSHRLLTSLRQTTPSKKEDIRRGFGRALLARMAAEPTKRPWSYLSRPDFIDRSNKWEEALKAVPANLCNDAYTGITNSSPQSVGDGLRYLANLMRAEMPQLEVALLSANRKIEKGEGSGSSYSGEGLIDRLARLEKPGALNQKDKEKFRSVEKFVQNILENQSVTIEVPYDRDTINIEIDGKSLPFESLGSGLHELIIIGVAASVLDGFLICIEEPEIHLNPILQRKLMVHLKAQRQNQYFISTHSPTLLDCADAEVYHLRLQNGSTVVDRVTTGQQRFAVCIDLGYHPSDLLQANCIVWVEGPSDRLYLNWWLQAKAPDLMEGVHFSIMFYGGRLLSHLGFDGERAVKDFIELRRLNQRGAIIMDSDRKASESDCINATKQRLSEEFSTGGYVWVTSGREVENYVRPGDLAAAIAEVHPKARVPRRMGRFDCCLKMKGADGKSEVKPDKVGIAHHVVANGSLDFNALDLSERVMQLVAYIRSSNPE